MTGHQMSTRDESNRKPDPEAGAEALRFGVGKSILFSMIAVVLVLGIAEMGIRGWALFLREKIQSYDSRAGSFVLVPGEHRTELGVVKINPDGFPGRALEPAGSDLFRVLSIGDSCTFGAGDDRNTYPAMLDARLRSRSVAGVRFEVVNGGISGLDSELVLNRLRSIGPILAPKVITIYVGWNDLMKFDPAGQQRAGAGSRVARALDSLWLAKGLRKLIFFHIRPRLRPARTGAESRSGRFAAFRPTYYETTLREIVDAARELGAKPLLATLPTVVRMEMTKDDLIAANVVFPYFPSAYGVGDLLDLVASYNRVIRETGERLEVPVVDLASRFDGIADARPLFFDTMHTNDVGLAVIASELERGLDRAGLLPATTPGGD